MHQSSEQRVFPCSETNPNVVLERDNTMPLGGIIQPSLNSIRKINISADSSCLIPSRKSSTYGLNVSSSSTKATQSAQAYFFMILFRMSPAPFPSTPRLEELE